MKEYFWSEKKKSFEHCATGSDQFRDDGVRPRVLFGLVKGYSQVHVREEAFIEVGIAV